MKLLVIEDEHRIAQSIRQGLEQEAYAVDVEYDGEDGYNAARNGEYDAIVLDLMLPSMDGLQVCAALRADGNHVPVLMLTARDQTRDVVAGLNTGADDYLAKPFAFEVLLARIRALLRRPHDTVGAVLKSGDLEMDTIVQSVMRGKQPVKLSAKEYAILEYLLRNKGRVLSKSNIMAHVWDFDADILPNNVEVFIAYLRNKIDKPFKTAPLITTVRGFGYRLEDV